MGASILQFNLLLADTFIDCACFQWASGASITTIWGDQLYRALGRRETMKQVVNKAVLFSSLRFASAVISISKCCPLREALDQLGACQKVLEDRFKEEVFFLGQFTLIMHGQ